MTSELKLLGCETGEGSRRGLDGVVQYATAVFPCPRPGPFSGACRDGADRTHVGVQTHGKQMKGGVEQNGMGKRTKTGRQEDSRERPSADDKK